MGHGRADEAGGEAVDDTANPDRVDCLIIGGGPAGLYFAISMKLRDPAHEVTVFERNRPGGPGARPSRSAFMYSASCVWNVLSSIFPLSWSLYILSTSACVQMRPGGGAEGAGPHQDSKTIVVELEDRKQHALYGKIMRRNSRVKAHDENNTAGIGDRVRIMETRPLSATKRWRLVEILEKAK